MKSIAFAFFASVVLLSAHAFGSGTLVIVDVDDTIKESHVGVLSQALLNATRTDIPFWQMASLLGDLKAGGARIVYVSTAPRTPMESYHRAFLQQNGFPKGDLFLPGYGQRKDYKLRTIRDLLTFGQPETVIFFGDNGEQDPAVYGTIEAENPNLKFLTFIRWAYANWTVGPFLRQTPFVTVGEISLELFEAGFLSNPQTRMLLGASLFPATPPAERDGTIVPRKGLNLPDWIDCTGFHPDLSRFKDFAFQVEILQAEIERRCETTP